MNPEVAEALALLESDAALPEEPSAYRFVHPPGRMPPMRNQISTRIPYKTYARHARAHERLQARWNQHVCETEPVNCRACGVSFYRENIKRVNCDSCVAEIRRLRGSKGKAS